MLCGITKTVVRAGLITALAGGVAVVVAGPETVRAFLQQARSNAERALGSAVSDPVALRAQLESLAEQYPGRIAEVRGSLAELDQQIATLEREQAVARKVVAMADSDLEQMRAVLARAEAARASGEAEVVRVRFEDSRSAVNLEEAYGKANRVVQLRNAYAQRVSDMERDLGYLGQQRDRLVGLLEQLTTEHAEFQSQLFALNQQVEAIQRNDRMIELMESRQATIESHSRFRATSLDGVKSRLAEIRSKQEAKLDALGQSSDMRNYENAARYLLENEGRARPGSVSGSGLRLLEPRAVEVRPSVIEIGPSEARPGVSEEATPLLPTGPVVRR